MLTKREKERIIAELRTICLRIYKVQEQVQTEFLDTEKKPIKGRYR